MSMRRLVLIKLTSYALTTSQMAKPRAVAEVDLDALAVQVEGLDLEENEFGSGAYGMIFKVTLNGKECIAKKLHKLLIHAVKYYPRGQDDSIVRKFENECRILSQLEHPNVVGFVGVHFGHDRNDISLIMERLHCDLADFVKKNPDTPLCDRLHILYDVSKGLDYLHSQSPPLIHRDLTAPNVLLTEDFTAKIGDLGVSRYIDPKVDTKLTVAPGNLYYMPPECRVQSPCYTTKLDIFSFGNLIIHTVIGNVPKVFDFVSSDPNLIEYIQEKKVELMRRDDAIHQQLGKTHCLYPLAVHCLHDSPDQRPSVGEVRGSLRQLCLKQYPGMTLCEACMTGNMAVVEELLENGTDPNQADKDLSTALYQASKHGHYEVVTVLLAAKATVDSQGNGKQSPLWIASHRGNLECVKLLIEEGANVNLHAQMGFTALHVASQAGHCRVVQVLLEANAEVNTKSNENQTPLLMASWEGHDEVVRVLLAAKAKVNIQNKWGESSLWLASFNGHQKCAELLIEAGAHVDMPKEDGGTALLDTAYNGHLKIIEILIASKANINHQDNDGFTALHMACQEGHLKIAETLITAHASVNAQNKFNQTPLMCAAEDGHSSIVELLLSKGADTNLKNNDGETANNLARKNRHDQVCQQLLAIVS